MDRIRHEAMIMPTFEWFNSAVEGIMSVGIPVTMQYGSTRDVACEHAVGAESALAGPWPTAV